MSLAEIVMLVLKISVLAIVFAIGLNARPADLICVVRRPARLARSLLAMVIVMPLVAVLLVQTFDLPHPVTVMLVALSLAPVPPILPRKQAKAGGDAVYAVGLLAAVGLISIFWIPMELELIERTFGVPLGASPIPIARLVAISILAPLVLGILIARLAPGPAGRLAPLLSTIGNLSLLAGLAAILASQWPRMMELVGDGTLFAMVIFVVLGLAAGHLLGGPEPDDRTVLAMATASRHPGVAMAVASINFPQEKPAR